jgi:hypothetical protein
LLSQDYLSSGSFLRGLSFYKKLLLFFYYVLYKNLKTDCLELNVYILEIPLIEATRAIRDQECQDGGAATQSPAERFHSGSNPDLGFFFKQFIALKLFYIVSQTNLHNAKMAERLRNRLQSDSIPVRIRILAFL